VGWGGAEWRLSESLFVESWILVMVFVLMWVRKTMRFCKTHQSWISGTQNLKVL